MKERVFRPMGVEVVVYPPRSLDAACASMRVGSYRMAAFSDLQAHAWQAATCGRDRVGDCVSCVTRVFGVAIQTACNSVAFLGDFFEAKGAVRVDVAARVYDAFMYGVKNFVRANQHVFVVAGNHDYHRDEASVSLLSHALSDMVHVYTDASVNAPRGGAAAYSHSGVQINAYPYRRGVVPPPDYSASDALIGLSHETVGGAWVARGVAESSVSGLETASKLPPVVLQGHYHRPQVRRVRHSDTRDHHSLVVVVGAPMAHDWSDLDAPNDRGCVILEVLGSGGDVVDQVRVHRIVFDDLPRFVSDASKARDCDFVLPSAGVTAKTRSAAGRAVEALGATYDARALVETYVRAERGIPAPYALPKDVRRLVEIGVECMMGGRSGR